MSVMKLRYGKTGNSVCLVLPKEVAAELKAVPGEHVFLVKDEDGTQRLTPYDPEFENKMEIAKNIMSRYKNALRALAK